MVMLTAVFTKEMRTARNVFIFGLALSDFLLALTIPATVYDAVTASWQMSANLNLCRSENWRQRLANYIYCALATLKRGNVFEMSLI